MAHSLLVSLFLASASLVSGLAAQSIPRVIVETDMGGDTDDAALVAFANHLADQGKIELLAVMHNGNNPWGGAAISAVNTYYGRPELPIGTYRTAAEAGRPEYHPLSDPSNPSSPRIPLSYTGPSLEGHWVRLLAENFPCHYRTRLGFPDAVDVYKDVLANVPDDSVVIVNGGFLGNLSNVIAYFEVDTVLRNRFQAKVNRKTGAIGGVNTCDNGVFPSGLAEHVVNNPIYATATATWFGPPVLGTPAFGTTDSLATMPVDNPVREAYRYKTEVENGWRGTSLAWNWHIIDVVTSFSVIAWDDFTDAAGIPWFDLPQGPEWLDVSNNCASTIVDGTPAIPHWDFQEAGAHVPSGFNVTQASERLNDRCIDDGIMVAPSNPWSPEREHLNVTALFRDGTLGGFDLNGAHPNAGVDVGRFIAPASTNTAGGTSLIAEGRRYFDQTILAYVSQVPPAGSQPLDQTTGTRFEIRFWSDSRSETGWGDTPLLRVVGWPGRGQPAQGGGTNPGTPVYRVELWDHTSSGFVKTASYDVQNTPVGYPYQVRVWIEGNQLRASLNGEAVFGGQAVTVQSPPPFDGGMTQLCFNGLCPVGEYHLDYALIRPYGGSEAIPDVYVDKVGNAWFSYLKNGDFAQDLFFSEGGASSHFVELNLVPRPGWPGVIPAHFPWSHPTNLDWVSVLQHVSFEGAGQDHWIYGIENFPWRIGDEIVLEYRGLREGEQVPELPN